ncbi:tyrosinase family oxidase copper chaperone [Actinoplanes derwentensis]|nr:tyrosinase family oxidase copper chaperone [Actinoplanes derwentensis]GID81172.1 hypothetical protein Ade03nite_00960 [Actinoplanes derwentensis]
MKIFRKQEPRRSGGTAKRTVVVLAAAAGALAAAGTALAAAPAVDMAKKPGFYETYRGHHIMGWGTGESACAYIDGKRLVLYPAPDGKYTSAIQGFKPETSVRNITKASVKALGNLGLSASAEPSATCPDLTAPAPKPTATATPKPTATATPAATTATPKPTKS